MRIGSKMLALALVMAPALAGLAAAADPAPLAVGQKALAFKLKDQNGDERSLDDLLQKGKVALVFFRSADW
ncbi:MAG: redoxin domain-containing protein [Planctomycetia bacterium]|nr:redoxin domain-containing protein [Planctomycetia bacterium]